MVAINPYLGMVSSLDSDDFDALCSIVAERKCRELIGAGMSLARPFSSIDFYGTASTGTLDEAAALWRPHPSCPSCGFPDCWQNGKNPADHKRWLCPECGSQFSALTGIVLEYGKKGLSTWERFITCMSYNAPIDLIAEVCEVTYKTAFEWGHRVYATVDGYQNRLKLSGRTWIDELYLTDSDIVRSADFVQKRGLYKNKICIAVAIDAFKNAVVIICGHGKPSPRRIKGALLSHITPGSVIVRDKERPLPAPVKAAKCTDESCNADVTGPAYLEAMELVNNLCSWLRRCLFCFPGMRKGNL